MANRSRGARAAFLDWAAMLHGHTKRRNIMGMLKAYFDETENKRFAFCVAGYLAEANTWASLQDQWLSRLRLDSVDVFHATDCWNLKRSFEDGWDVQRRDRLLIDLVDIVTSHQLVAFGSGVLSASVRAVFPMCEDGRIKPLMYGLCLLEQMPILCRAVHGLWPAKRVAVVYEYLDGVADDFQQLLKRVKESGDFDHADVLASMVPMEKTDREAVMLQTADLLAWETGRHLYNQFNHPHIPTRAGFQRLRQQFHVDPTYVDDEFLLTLKQADIRQREVRLTTKH